MRLINKVGEKKIGVKPWIVNKGKNSGDKWEKCQGSEKEWEDNMETTLDEFGQIVISKEIRDDFNLKPGCRIRYY